MDWKQLIADLEQDMTQASIAEAVGLASSGHVANLKSGYQQTVRYEVGCKLVDLHRKVMRKRARREKA